MKEQITIMKAGLSPGSASVALRIYKLLIVGDTP